MEFKFEAHQDYQLQAIEAVTNLFEGQPRIEVDLQFALGTGFAAVSNRLDLDDETILKNLQSVQEQNGLTPDTFLQHIEEKIATAGGEKLARFTNFSVEMETGTGKTYVYLRTSLELFRRYGMRKFVVVVPSVAVREGVLKTLQVTEKHLRKLYDNAPYRYYSYDSSNLSQLRQFALSSSVEMMVMTIDSFNKASNVIRQTTDHLQGETPIHLVQATRPILILDEPQNMESELRVKALAALDPLLALRYSATHRNPYNLVYRLTPYEAYRQRLVKRIEIAGVEQRDDANRVFLRLDDMKSAKKTLTARITVQKLMANGTVKEQTVTVKPGDKLEQKANRPEYAGFTVDEINLAEGFVRFSNGNEIRKGESQGPDKEAIFKSQIRYTIEEHFRKQAKLNAQKIKVLSLFFIDRVENYAAEDGIIRRFFNQCFNELKDQYPDWCDVNPEDVQAAYFAQRRTREGNVIYEDSRTGEAEKDKEAYDLIMRDKERLLSLEEPKCFIFSHSALREGWDNPNVFQICTLNQTISEMKKRQEVGRGVRLAVNQAGDRVRDDNINILTVVANESYEHYVQRLQAETAEEYGADGVPPPPSDARKRGVARLRKEYLLKPEFKELWERIKHKTRYAVTIDSEKLITETVAALDDIEVRPPRVTITRARVEVEGEDSFAPKMMSSAKTVLDLAGRYPLPNLLDLMTHILEQTTPPMRLTRRTLLKIFRGIKNKQAALDNPHEFAAIVVSTIKNKLANLLINGIQYEKIEAWYEMSRLENEIQAWEEYLVPAERSLYDNVIFQSDTEKRFVEDLEQSDFVKLYVKLPNWFTVNTPVGEYNPDWAIVLEPRDAHGHPTGGQLLYLVCETKDTTDLSQLRLEEAQKIRCGQRHFRDALNVNYEVASNVSNL